MRNPPGILVNFIRDGEPVPEVLLDAKRKAEELREAETKRKRKESLEKVRQMHQEAHSEAFETYLMSELAQLEKTNHEAFTAFQKDFEKKFARVIRDVSEQQCQDIRLLHWSQYAAKHPEFGLLTFWQWDAERNPEPFTYDQGYRSSGSLHEFM